MSEPSVINQLLQTMSQRMVSLKTAFTQTEQQIDRQLSGADGCLDVTNASRLCGQLRAEVDALTTLLAAVDHNNDRELIGRERRLASVHTLLVNSGDDTSVTTSGQSMASKPRKARKKSTKSEEQKPKKVFVCDKCPKKYLSLYKVNKHLAKVHES